ncbi:GNAT family N-acetyltransferase [Riemerella anatipestifer]|nr:GNAT family N-acetyltransferase [Riemerella anatipestifer]
MNSVQINPIYDDATKLTKIYQSYSNTFPEDERRDESGFWALVKEERALICDILNDGNAVGYIVLWDLSSCLFVEHFEIYTSFRNQNFGFQVLDYLKSKFPLVVLESEPENLGELASRRLNFYQRNGFVILDKNYIQPAYSKGKMPVNMCLLGTYMPDDLLLVIEEIRDIVYK